jgi:fructosamine-3-kinase
MNVEGAEAAGSKQLARQQQAVGRDDQRIGAQRAHPFDVLQVLEVRRLRKRDATRLGETLHRACNRTQPAAGGPVGLGQGENDLMARRQEPRQRPFGKLGRAGEDEAQERTVRLSCAAASRASRGRAAA